MQENTYPKRSLKALFIALCLVLFIVPQLIQQIAKDQLPQTGDIINKRFVFLLTNFPNFDPDPILTDSARSKMLHFDISFFNILTGLTEWKAFYGFGIVNLVGLVMAIMLTWAMAERWGKNYALLAPLLFIATPALVGPFLGQTDIYLIYIFLPLAVFLLWFTKPTLLSKIALTLLFIGTVNSHFMLWLPLFLLTLVIEVLYPRFNVLLILPLSVIMSWCFLEIPLGYLSGFNTNFLLWGAVTSLFGVLGLYGIRRFFPKVSRVLIVMLGLGAIFFFSFPQAGDPTYQTISIEDIKATAGAFKNGNPWHFIFSINPGKGFPGTYTHSMIITVMIIISVVFLRKMKSLKLTEEVKKRLTLLYMLILMPFGLIILQFVLLKINYKLFSLSPLGAQHTGRINIISFFFVAIPLLFLLQRLVHKKGWLKPSLIALMIVLVLNGTRLSQFYFLRVTSNIQSGYQKGLQESLEIGRAEGLSSLEAEYSCYFYKHCNLKVGHDAPF